MATSCSKVLTLPVLASTALNQFRAVTALGALPPAGGRCFGVTDFAAGAGDRVSVGVMGTVIAEAGGAFPVDALLEVDAIGRFILASTGIAVARAITRSAGVGAYVEVLLMDVSEPGSTVANVPHLFSRPASGVTYQGGLFTNAGNLKTYDSQSAYRAMVPRRKIRARITNVTKLNGDGPEVVSTTPLRVFTVMEFLNDAGNAPLFFEALYRGVNSVVFPANVPTIIDVEWDLPFDLPTDRNYLIKNRIEHEDGVSQIVVPVGSPGDYNAATLGARGAEGQIFNSATNLSKVSAGGQVWGARGPGLQYRPLAVFAVDGPMIRSAVVPGDSISSPLDSAVSQILNAAGIPNVNIGAGGESQNNWLADNEVRYTVIAFTKTMICALGNNGNGAGANAAFSALKVIFADARSKGVEHIIAITQGPNTSPAATNPNPLTVDGQAPETSGVRIAVNQMVRDAEGQTGGPDEVWDFESVLCTPDKLKFKDGYSTDYRHLTKAANTALVEYATARNATARIK